MPASTPFLGLYKPGGGSSGLITPDEVVDIDRLNTNADLIDAFAKSYGPATERNRQLYGPTASLSGVTGMKLGDLYQESDSLKRVFRYDGTSWVLFAGNAGLAYSTGWSDFGETAGCTVRFGMASLVGRTQAASGSGGDTILTVGPEARPADNRTYSIPYNSGVTDIIVQADGKVVNFGRGAAARSDLRLGNIPPWAVKMS